VIRIPDAFFNGERAWGEMSNVHYLREATDLGIPEAQHNLALFYMDQEEEKYLHYITLAVSQDHSKGAFCWDLC